MPLRHVVMFRWGDHVDAGHVQRVREAYDALAAQATGLRSHTHGSDVGLSVDTFDFHVVVDFETVADWRAYRDHPAHVLLRAELIDGYVVDQAAGQLPIPDDRSAHEISSARTQSLLAEPGPIEGATATDESDDELLARARRAAMAEMEALLAEPDDPA